MKPEDNKSVSDLACAITEKQKEFSLALKDLNTIEQEILLLQRDILELQLKKKGIEVGAGKAKHNVRQLALEIKMLSAKFWESKNL